MFLAPVSCVNGSRVKVMVVCSECGDGVVNSPIYIGPARQIVVHFFCLYLLDRLFFAYLSLA